VRTAGAHRRGGRAHTGVDGGRTSPQKTRAQGARARNVRARTGGVCWRGCPRRERRAHADAENERARKHGRWVRTARTAVARRRRRGWRSHAGWRDKRTRAQTSGLAGTEDARADGAGADCRCTLARMATLRAAGERRRRRRRRRRQRVDGSWQGLLQTVAGGQRRVDVEGDEGH
jgi:hypothetical protein